MDLSSNQSSEQLFETLKNSNNFDVIDEHLIREYGLAIHKELMLSYTNANNMVIEEFLIDEAIADVLIISNLNEEKIAKELLKTQFVIINKQDIIKSE